MTDSTRCRFKALHFADLHLEGVSGGQDQASVLAQIVDLVATEGVDVVHINGDIFDQRSTPGQRLTFKAFLDQLDYLGAKTCILRGNHDEPNDLMIFASNSVTVMERPQVVEILPGYRVRGIPHFSAALASRGATGLADHTDTVQNALTDLMETWRNEAWADSEMVNVLVFHGVVDGASLDTGIIPRENGIHLSRHWLDQFPGVCVGGHYHTTQDIMSNGRVWYSGSPCRHSFAEDGPKGVLLVHYEGEYFDWPRVEFRALQVPTSMVLRGSYDGQVITWDTPPPETIGADVKLKIKVDKAHLATLGHDPAVIDLTKQARKLIIEPIVQTVQTARCEGIAQAASIEECLVLWLTQSGYNADKINEITSLYRRLKGANNENQQNSSGGMCPVPATV